MTQNTSSSPAYSGTTSDGHPTHPMAQSRGASGPEVDLPKPPPRKIKPPSAKFLNKASATPDQEKSTSMETTPEPQQEEAPVKTEPKSAPTLQGPAPGATGDDIEFSGPAADSKAETVKKPEPQPTEELGGPPPKTAAAEPELGAPTRPAPAKQASATGSEELGADRAAAELKELQDIVGDLESLKFLKPRLARCQKEGADSATLLSFYRLTSRALKDEVKKSNQNIDQFRRTMQQMRGKMSEAEMKLAVAAATPSEGGGEGGGGSPADGEKVRELEAKLEEMTAQREKLLQDFQNMRNRAQMDVELKVFKAVEKFASTLLPALDAFNQAMPSLRNSTDVDAVTKGIEMIYSQLTDSLEKAGLTKLEAVGQAFDPNYHEAIGEVVTETMPDEYVYDQYQPGYLFGERLLRAALVRVARNPTGVVKPDPNAPVAAVAAEEPPAEAAAAEAQTSDEAAAEVEAAAPEGEAPDPPTEAAPEPAENAEQPASQEVPAAAEAPTSDSTADQQPTPEATAAEEPSGDTQSSQPETPASEEEAPPAQDQKAPEAGDEEKSS